MRSVKPFILRYDLISSSKVLEFFSLSFSINFMYHRSIFLNEDSAQQFSPRYFSVRSYHHQSQKIARLLEIEMSFMMMVDDRPCSLPILLSKDGELVTEYLQSSKSHKIWKKNPKFRCSRMQSESSLSVVLE